MKADDTISDGFEDMDEVSFKEVITWHKYPDEKPLLPINRYGGSVQYLVQLKESSIKGAYWNCDFFFIPDYDGTNQQLPHELVIAWAKMPKGIQP